MWRIKGWSLLCIWTYTCAEREILYNTYQEMAIWLKEKGQKDKTRSTKHRHKTEDGVTTNV
jgi:hypothetical protein